MFHFFIFLVTFANSADGSTPTKLKTLQKRSNKSIEKFSIRKDMKPQYILARISKNGRIPSYLKGTSPQN